MKEICVIPTSPRAEGVLFTFSRPKGLIIASKAEFYAEFENPFLIKIRLGRFSQIDFEMRYPLQDQNSIRDTRDLRIKTKCCKRPNSLSK